MNAPMTPAQAAQQNNRTDDGKYATRTHPEHDTFTPPAVPHDASGDTAAAMLWEAIRDDEDNIYCELDDVTVDDDDGHSFRLFVGEVADRVAARDFPGVVVVADCTVDDDFAYDGFEVSLQVQGKARPLALSAGWQPIDKLVPDGTARGLDTVRAIHDKVAAEIAELVSDADGLGLSYRVK